MADTDITDAWEIVITLRALVGTKLVSYLGHSTDTSTVNGWSDGTLPVPTGDLLERLRIALAAAQILTRRDTPGVVRTSILICRTRISGAQHLLNAPNERQGRSPISVNVGRCNRTNLSADPQ